MKRRHAISTIKGHLDLMKEDGMEHVLFPKSQKRPTLRPTASHAGSKESKRDQIIALKAEIDGCTKCAALVGNRTKTVFGAGHVNTELMFVGEAPGRDEDIQGIPFVGKAGQLLTKMIEAMGLTRNQVFIANVLKCRPPENRNPIPEEISNCEAFLLKQIEIIEPKVICALGSFAAKTLLKTDTSISRLRGKFHDYHGIMLLPTFHPSYLLRSPGEKRKAWEDLKMIKKELGI